MATIGKLVWIALFIILLSSGFIDAQITPSKMDRGSEKLKRFNHSQDRLVLANNTLENFNRALNFLTINSEFQPLLLSIGSFGSRNKILDTITEYLKEHTVDYYRFDLNNFAKRKPKLQLGLTWIVVVDEYNTLDFHARGHANFWRAADRFFILFVGKKTNESSNECLAIFKILWNQHQVCKVLITSIHENFRYLYRYMPLDKVGEEFGTVQRFIVEDTSNSSLIVRDKEVRLPIKGQESLQKVKSNEGYPMIFEDFRNFDGYPIHVTIFASVMMNITTNKDKKTIYRMLDANVMNLVEERLGSKFQIKVMGIQKRSDPFMKALDTLQRKNGSDIVFTAYLTKPYPREFAFSASVFTDKLCLVGPSSKPIPKFFMPLLPFANELWFLLFLYNSATAVLWLLIQRLQSTFRARSKATTTVPDDTMIRVLNHGIPQRSGIDRYFKRPRQRQMLFRHSRSYSEPRKIHPWIVGFVDLFTLVCHPLSGGKTHTERAFLFGTLFFGLIVVGLYQSYLVSSLSKPIFYPELNTLLDVVDSNRTIITKYENLVQDSFVAKTPVFEKLRKKMQISTSPQKTFDMVAYSGFVSIGRFSSFQLENLTDYYNRATNKLMLHLVEECEGTFPLSYPVRLNSPYLQRINDLLLRIQQAGFIQKWYDDMLRQAKFQAAKVIPSRSNERAKLTLDHLSLIFVGLGIGIFCSTIVFLGELYYARKLRCSASRPSTLSNKRCCACRTGSSDKEPAMHFDRNDVALSQTMPCIL